MSPVQIAAYAALVADALGARGVVPGDRVALWLRDGVDQVSAMLGCWMAGAYNILTLPDFTTVAVDGDAPKPLTMQQAADDMAFVQFTPGSTGGEAVFPKVLETFEQVYAPSGLGAGVMQPIYGMAETVVGISCGEPGTRWQVEEGAVSCGPPLADMQVQIVDDGAVPVEGGREGRIMVRGPSVMAGYLGQPRFAEHAWFETGDLGFLRGGLLYVTGRLKDVLKRGGESFPAALIEVVAEQALALRTGRAAVFSIPRVDLGKEEIVLLVESRNWQDDHARTVAAAVVRDLGLQIDVIRATNGTRLPRTSSGKLMRQQAAALYREGLI